MLTEFGAIFLEFEFLFDSLSVLGRPIDLAGRLVPELYKLVLRHDVC